VDNVPLSTLPYDKSHGEEKRRKYMRRLVALFFVFVLMGCAQTKVVVKEVSPDQVIHYSQLQKLEKVASLYNTVAYVDKGETIPMEISLESDLVGLKDKKVDFILKERIYFMLRMPENLSNEELSALESLDHEKLSKMSEAEQIRYFRNLMLSRDAIHWAPLANIKAMKEVLEIKGGSIALGFGMNRKEGIWSFLKMKMTK